ncbi:efflux RND transporter periplasmic adaptor subunit [Actibacterium sp. 188UL27-1]|uniref:efflux RND transporter periplasmic adaptor subunit n=1 Tax=Actibacterium sp. 188UL27-1 TaxID=2786961 RepID=UPI00195849C0|nr:HlyD family efflux transporter periplasmic adaptor subunit [Actibacterium sp. 188UL27-1]MBM7069286.1 HlyD family efflux transporter periplasmic adaptor subunit [Actibacterium sp. 188UL27-1]
MAITIAILPLFADTLATMIGRLQTYFLAGVLACIAAAPAAAQDGLAADGLIVSRNQVRIASQIAGQVIRLPKRDGEAFNAGDLLVEIDCAILQAEIIAAEKRQAAAQARFDINARLDRAGAVAKGELRVTKAEAEGAEAEAEALRQQFRQCTVTAPFDGRVVDLHTAEFASVSSTEDLLTVIDDVNLEVELIVPSVWLKWLETGTTFRFQIFETEQVLDLAVSQIGAAIDPVSRTISLRAAIAEKPPGILSGMTGRAIFAAP